MKIKNILKNEYFILAAIILLALLIRLISIDKPFGIWYDEMYSYIFSSKSSVIEITKTLMRYDFHMPLYYFYVHFWMKFFGTSDVALRLSSVLWGVLSIPALYCLGKTYRSKALGYFLAVISCLSPVMIYYSQEIRFYGMLMFFATISIIFFLRLIDSHDKKDFMWFAVANFVILYIYTMGAIFVAIEFFLLFIHFYKKEFFTPLLKYSIVFFVFSIPYLILLYSYLLASHNSILSPFSWSEASCMSIVLIINDLFSPFLVSQMGNSATVYIRYLHSPVTILLLTFFSLSTFCFMVGFFRSFKNIDKKFIYIFTIAIFFYTVEIFLNLTSGFVLVTKYTLICLPILFLIAGDGLLSLQNKKLRKTLIAIILVIFIVNIINYKNMPAFSLKPNGYKLPAEELIKLNITKKDYIIYPSGAFFLEKYLPASNYIEFNIPYALFLDKTKTESLKIFDKSFIEQTNKKNAVENFKSFLANPSPSKPLIQFVTNYINKVPSKGRMIFVSDYDLMLSPKRINNVIKQMPYDNLMEKAYSQSLFYLTYNKVFNDLNIIFNNNHSLKLKQTFFVAGPGRKNKKWKIFVYEKL